MASLTFPVLVLAAICIFHAESGDAKAMPSTRDKRAPERYSPRLGRRSEEERYSPRLGRRSEEITDPNQLKNIVLLDPRLKEEYKKIFLNILQEEIDKTNSKLTENFFAYPRQGRAMDDMSKENFFHWPRQGKRVDGKIDETCCSEGIISIYSETGKKTYCNGIQCCEGLEKRFEEVDNNLSKEGQSVLVACIPEEFGDSQIHAAS